MAYIELIAIPYAAPPKTALITMFFNQNLCGCLFIWSIFLTAFIISEKIPGQSEPYSTCSAISS